MTTSTTGTGTITLGSASDGFQSFADAGVANGDIIRYVIEDGNNFEIGSGTYTSSGTTLSRTVVESSESDNSAITLSGSAVVFSTIAAQDFGEGPIITTEPPTVHELNNDGSTSSLTMFAKDPDGFPITYGIAYPTTDNALPSQLTSATSINQSTGAYTFTPSTSTSDAGTVKVRLSASDGVRNTTRLSTLSLAFQLDFDVLVIGGGGGGGSAYRGFTVAGGGGAGGVIATTFTDYETSTFTITIGAGGIAGNILTPSDGGVGGDTIMQQTSGSGFTTLTAGGGGNGGGVGYPTPGAAGRANNGSGGGGTGGGNPGSGGAAGTSYISQGYAGAAGMNGSPYAGGGGGGSAEAGGTDANGDGGDGIQSSITGTATYYAGGGAGGCEDTTLNVNGGLGGGGDGGQLGGRTATAATGYGSGGAGSPGHPSVNPSYIAGTAGSAGVVIIASTVPATATTGSPSVDSSSRSGYTIYTFTSNGTITLTKPS